MIIDNLEICKYYDPPNFLPNRMLTFPKALNSYELDNRFSNTDDSKKLEKSLQTQPEDWHYRKKEIYYNVNKDEYRTLEWDQIDWANSIVIFGCSCVAGIGLAEDETISFYLQENTGRPVINMGVPGSSIDFSFYNSLILKEYYPTPYAVIYGWTVSDRITYFDKDKPVMLGKWNLNKDNIYYHWNKEKTNSAIHVKFITSAARLLWANQIKYYDFSFFNETSQIVNCPFIKIDNDARDLLHPGRKNTKLVADMISIAIK